ncbi:MAG: heparinase II/III family protein, partial [Chitinophagaceae bacterium]
GYGYWDYGTTFNVLFLDAIERLYRTDFGLSAIPGFLESAGFMENMAGPTGLPFNYSDAGLGNGLHPAMFWIANKLGNSTLLWGEKKFLRKENAKNLVRDRALPAMLIWKGKIQLEAIRPPSQVNWIGHGKNPIAMMRTSWSDPNAIYIAAKGGSASINHAHMDAGSFVMDANGERWAMDFGSQNYESLESKGIKLWQRTQDSERWTVFRLNNFSHNTLIVDSQLHVMNGKASIIQQQMDEKNTQVTIDLGPVYANQLRSAKRSIAIIENQYVLTKDEIETLGHETKIRWNLLTPAKVEITGPHSAILRIGSKRLTLTASGAKNITMKTWSTEPPRPYDAPNPGTVIVGIETVIPADSKAVLEVTLVPGKQ